MVKLIFEISKNVYDINDSIRIESNYTIDETFLSNLYINLYEDTDSGYVIVNTTFVPEYNSISKVMGALIVPTEPLKDDTTYTVELKNISGANNSELDIQYLNFFASNLYPTRNANDIYYQLENIDNLLSADAIFTDNRYTNNTFIPEEYNLELQKYYPVKDTAGNFVEINVENTDIIRDLYINEFLTEYKNYFDDIINRNDLTDAAMIMAVSSSAVAFEEFELKLKQLNFDVVNNDVNFGAEKVPGIYYGSDVFAIKNFLQELFNSITSIFSPTAGTGNYANRTTVFWSDEEIAKLNLLIAENIVKLNALKGSQRLIEIVLGMYAKILGFQLISVIPDGDHNFIYRISTSVPQIFWRQNIRPIVHPMGWFDIYSEIDSQLGEYQIEISRDRLNLFNVIRNQWKYHLPSWLDAEYYATKDYKFHYVLSRILFHLYGNISADNNVFNHEHLGHDYCTFLNKEDDKTFNLKVCGEQSEIAYFNENLFDEIYNPSNLSFVIDRSISGGKKQNSFEMFYGTPGIAIEYFWKTFKENTLLTNYRTAFNTYKIDFTTMPASAYKSDKFNYHTVLELKHYDWSKEIHIYDASSLYNYRAIIASWSYANSNRKLLNTRNYYNLGSQMINMKTESLETEYINKSIGFIDDFNYSIPASAFTAEFDYDATIFSRNVSANATPSGGYFINARPWRQQYTFNNISNGDITGWSAGGSLPAYQYHSQAIVTNSRVYLLGGKRTTGTTNIVYTAPINPDGTLGTWTTDASLPGPLQDSQAVVTKDRVYLLGGQNGVAVSTVYTAPINPDGTLGTWTTGTSLPTNRRNAQAIVIKSYVYLIGGHNGSSFLSSIIKAPINADGTIGAWSITTSLPGPSAEGQAIITKDRIYLLGGYSGAAISTVYTAPISANGTIGTWTTAASLPDALHGSQAVITENRVYLLGGFKSSAKSVVYTAPISADGTLGTWSTGTSLPVTIEFSQAIVSSSRVYLIGNYSTAVVYSASFLGGKNDYSLDTYQPNIIISPSGSGAVLAKIYYEPKPASASDGSLIEGLGSIATKYVWKIYRNGILEREEITYFNLLEIPLFENILHEYTISLTITLKDTDHLLSNIVSFI